MFTDFDYPKLIGALTAEERIRFYDVLAHNLTVSVRGIWSDEQLNNVQKIEGMKCVNEIMHRVTARAAALRLSRDSWSEEDFWATVKHWVAASPDAAQHVRWAIRSSYEWCRS